LLARRNERHPSCTTYFVKEEMGMLIAGGLALLVLICLLLSMMDTPPAIGR
jgi:hypothetical protein